MNVLVITQPAWNNQNNTGNTLSNFFDGTGFKFANLYFGGDLPDNDLCDKYYQISDFDIIYHLLKRQPLGRSFTLEKDSSSQNSTAKNTRENELKAKAFSNFYTQLLRELMWKFTSVLNNDVRKWISDFDPDIIYAPTFGNFHMLRIARKIADYFPNLPVISDISDDHYYRFNNEKNPIKYFFNTFLLRKSLLKTFKKYDLLYTMTDIQQSMYQPLLKAPIKIMRKKALTTHIQTSNNHPLQMIYAGGLYLGRDKVLEKMISALDRINAKENLLHLTIYSSTALTDALLDDLIQSKFITLNESIPYDKLIKKYDQSDIALLLESFSPEVQEQVKMSFSTKIVDALQSGCACLAIGPKTNAGFQYLYENGAGIICDDLSQLDKNITLCIQNIEKLKQNASALCQMNHDHERVTQQIQRDFKMLITSKKVQRV